MAERSGEIVTEVSSARPAVWPSVSVLIAQWGNVELTGRALESVRGSRYSGELQLLVYDNDSPGGPGRELLGADVTVVEGSTNIGFGPAINQLAESAQGDLLLILNNDVILEPRALTRLVRRLVDEPTAAVVVPQYRDFDGVVLEMGSFLGPGGRGSQFMRGRRVPASLRNVGHGAHYGSAAALLVRAADFTRQGGFSDDFAPAYYEDSDLCLRLRKEERSVLVEPTAIAFHYEGATAGRDVGSGPKALQETHRVLFARRWASFVEAQPPAGHAGSLQGALEPKPGGSRVLWLAPELPSAHREAGHHRMVEMMASLTEAGHSVLACAPLGRDTAKSGSHLESIGVVWTAENATDRWSPGADEVLGTLDELLSWVSWDTVVVSFAGYAAGLTERVRKACPDAGLIVDSPDVQFVRRERAALEGLGPMPSLASRQTEIRAYRSADGVIVASEVDGSVLAAHGVGTPMHAFPVPPFQPWQSSPNPAQLLFVGNLEHAPNLDAVDWWASEIAPELVGRFGIDQRLRVAGAGTRERAGRWGDLVDVVGWVDDISVEVTQARVFVAPLRYGSGTKGKLMLAFAGGVPIVTTSIGAEGFNPRSASVMGLADEPKLFAKMVADLVVDDAAHELQAGRVSAEGRRLWEEFLLHRSELAAWVTGGFSAPGPAR